MTNPPSAKSPRATVGKLTVLDALGLALGSSTVLGACFLLHSFMVG